MSQSTIDDIIKKKEAERAGDDQADKFFSILLGEGLQEDFLELQFNQGTRTCFAYSDLSWFSYNPEDGLGLEFGGYFISIRGRGLAPKLFNGLKQKRVAWVKEASVALQDNPANDCFIEEITIMPPEGFAGEDEAAE